MVARTSAKVNAQSLRDDSTVPLSLKNLRLFNSGAFSNVYRGSIEGQEGSDTEIVVKKTWGKQSQLNTEVSILKMLNRLNHKNMVRLLYTYSTPYPDNVCYSLIFEFLPMNLYQYLKSQDRKLQLVETKMFVWQLFRGLFHLERANIVHRDIKPQNLLVEPESGMLKISDFGSSCIGTSTQQHSYHVTRYYRPPELLLGSKQYGTEIDVWSAGCVFSEMLGGRVTFPGRNTNHQLKLIASCFGVPTNDDVNAMRASPSKFRDFKHNFIVESKESRTSLKKLLPLALERCDAEAQALVQKVLVFNPRHRLSGVELLKDPFFSEIFKRDAKRPNGRTVTCLGAEDLRAVENGDKSMTASTDNSTE